MVNYTPAFLVTPIYLTSVVFGAHLHGRDISEPLLKSYDYVVVGCGISGLVVSNRLSEIPTRTVLCIEAGDASELSSSSRLLLLTLPGIIMRPSFRIQSMSELTSAVSTTGTLRLYRKPN